MILNAISQNSVTSGHASRKPASPEPAVALEVATQTLNAVFLVKMTSAATIAFLAFLECAPRRLANVRMTETVKTDKLVRIITAAALVALA